MKYKLLTSALVLGLACTIGCSKKEQVPPEVLDIPIANTEYSIKTDPSLEEVQLFEEVLSRYTGNYVTSVYNPTSNQLRFLFIDDSTLVSLLEKTDEFPDQTISCQETSDAFLSLLSRSTPSP